MHLANICEQTIRLLIWHDLSSFIKIMKLQEKFLTLFVVWPIWKTFFSLEKPYKPIFHCKSKQLLLWMTLIEKKLRTDVSNFTSILLFPLFSQWSNFVGNSISFLCVNKSLDFQTKKCLLFSKYRPHSVSLENLHCYFCTEKAPENKQMSFEKSLIN